MTTDSQELLLAGHAMHNKDINHLNPSEMPDGTAADGSKALDNQPGLHDDPSAVNK